MYTDEDLNRAVEHGIFTSAAVTSFRQHMAEVKHTAVVDEENFRLIGGFNDIFVVIACLIVSFSAAWVAGEFNAVAGSLVMAACAWGLAEFFVRRRKMALPAIVLLLLFLWGVFNSGIAVFGASGGASLTMALATTAVAAGVHWWRFHVPVTVAAGVAAVIGLLFYCVLWVFPQSREWLTGIVLLGGLATFVVAMLWDMSDRQRLTRRADVAFWLHLLAAPLIVHPIFATLGVLRGNDSVGNVGAIVLVYVVMTLVSLVIDRRAFMVSSLAYVLYAVSSLLGTYGSVGSNLAVTGIIIGGALLLLAAFWHSVRGSLVARLPSALQQRVPVVDP